MGKLTNLKPRLAALTSTTAKLPYEQGKRDSFRSWAKPWRKWYHLKRWKDLRWATFIRDQFTCQMCGTFQADSALLVADHRKPHRGEEVRFFDPDNVHTLCASPCHSKHKQRMEQQGQLD